MTAIIIGSFIVVSVAIAFIMDTRRINRKLATYYKEQKNIDDHPLGRFRFPHNRPR